MNSKQLKEVLSLDLDTKLTDAVFCKTPTAETARTIAQDMVALFGPKPLVWLSDGSYMSSGRYKITHYDGMREPYKLEGVIMGSIYTSDLEDAIRKAQEHNDALHWANTNLAKIDIPHQS